MGTIDFGSEPAYWYEKTMRDSERNQLPTRSRPAINRDERLIAQEVRRHLDRVTIARATPAAAAQNRNCAHNRICAYCGQRFTRAQWPARLVWRVIYPRAGASGDRVELYRHLICPDAGRS